MKKLAAFSCVVMAILCLLVGLSAVAFSQPPPTFGGSLYLSPPSMTAGFLSESSPGWKLALIFGDQKSVLPGWEKRYFSQPDLILRMYQQETVYMEVLLGLSDKMNVYLLVGPYKTILSGKPGGIYVFAECGFQLRI